MTNSSCQELMNNIIEGVSALNFTLIFEQAEKKLAIRDFKVSQINPSNAIELYNSVYIKFKKNHITKMQLNWWQNELRIFIWILISYIQLRKLHIDELGPSDWQFFSRLFPNKQDILFQYQTISLYKENNNKKWIHEEDEMFSKLVQEISPRTKNSKYKWSELAKELYINSKRQYFRTPKQCRQRWLNHLDPNKSKQEWQLKEDHVLINHVKSKGKRWAQISKLLKNKRNQHSIKNRYKSLITKEEKNHDSKLPEQVLLEFIIKKYQNHFAKTKVVNETPKSMSENEKDEEREPLPTFRNIVSRKSQYALKAFQIFPTLNGQISSNPQIKTLEYLSFKNDEPIIPEVISQTSLYNQAQKEQKQKQIRAQMFLSEDPFHFLKRFFKSKDYYLYQ